MAGCVEACRLDVDDVLSVYIAYKPGFSVHTSNKPETCPYFLPFSQVLARHLSPVADRLRHLHSLLSEL